ncbi:MAG: hypothetical protein WC436_05305 [Candidatus Babeliales bacterium]
MLLLKNLFLTSILFLITSNNFANRIIFLNGASSANKSAIIQTLLSKLEAEGSTSIVSFNQTIFDIVNKKFISKYKQRPIFAIELELHLDTLLENGCQDLELENIDQHMYKKIKKLYQNGKNVIVDTIIEQENIAQKNRIKFYLKSFHNLPVFMINTDSLTAEEFIDQIMQNMGKAA